MKKIALVFSGFCLVMTLIQCSNNKTNAKDKENTLPANVENARTKSNVEEGKTLDLLQGKWQNIDDKTNFLVFAKDHRKETGNSMNDWNDEIFALSDHCLNESDSSSHDKGGKDSYISCKESDLCWNIASLDSNKLTLMYMGRGNLLTYKRVKE